MMPTRNIYSALVDAGIIIDSSVFKWGTLFAEHMRYDYSDAASNLIPWFFCEKDINKRCNGDEKGTKCLEIPIYAENQMGFRFLTHKRISLLPRINSVMTENISKEDRNNRLSISARKLKMLFARKSKKFDFCKCTLNEMKMMTNNILKGYKTNGYEYLPTVSIGHSKDFIHKNDFQKFLKYLKVNYGGVFESIPLTEAAKKFLEASPIEISSNKANLAN
jgi:hypothetical protein